MAKDTQNVSLKSALSEMYPPSSFLPRYFQLANNLHPQEVRPGIAVATVTGTLVSKDNRYTLEPLELSEIDVEKPQ